MPANTNNCVIETIGLTKVFRDFWGHKRVVAVDQLDLEIRHHEVFGLLGPNGSGKSTTIKMLLGLLFPSRGAAKVLGRPPGDVKTNARIGYLPEESHLYPFLNARETLDFYGRLFGLPAAVRKSRIESLLDMVGLAGLGRRAVGEFSKGMARRIGLAQALINDPDLLILDEPTTGLDPIGTRQIKDLIRQLGRRGKTVLLCSHLLADVEDVCDRIAILYGGKLQDQGSVNDLLALTDVTQIRTRQLSPAIVEDIRHVIQREHPDESIDVETPRDRLEDYFLRIVARAQAAEVATSGALMGAGLSDFLTRPADQDLRGETVIDTLVAGSPVDAAAAQQQAASAAQPVPVTPEDQPLQQEVLESLVKPTTTVVPDQHDAAPDLDRPDDNITQPVEPADTAADDAQDLDQSVIDQLLTRADNPEKHQPPNSPDPSDHHVGPRRPGRNQRPQGG